MSETEPKGDRRSRGRIWFAALTGTKCKRLCSIGSVLAGDTDLGENRVRYLALIQGVNADAPTETDIKRVEEALERVIADARVGSRTLDTRMGICILGTSRLGSNTPFLATPSNDPCWRTWKFPGATLRSVSRG